MLKKIRVLLLAIILASPLSGTFCRAENNQGPSDEDLNKILAEFKTDSKIDDQKTTPIEQKEPTVWQKLQIFWSLPFSTKKDFIKEHVWEHKVGYTICFVTVAGTVVGIIIYLKTRKNNSEKGS
jgi:hypothetical protein